MNVFFFFCRIMIDTWVLRELTFHIPVFTPRNWNIFRCTHKKWYPSGPLSFGVSPFEQEKKLHPVSQLYEVIAMTNTNTQFGISCLTAVVSPVQSKNMDLFFRQRIALGQFVLTCLPFYLVLVEVVTDELVQVRLLVICLVIYRIELQHPVIPVSLQRAFADAQQQA